MRQIIFSLVLIAGLTSCKKNYDCTCTYNDGTEEVTEVYDMGKKTGQDAKEVCSEQVASLEGYGGTNVS